MLKEVLRTDGNMGLQEKMKIIRNSLKFFIIKWWIKYKITEKIKSLKLYESKKSNNNAMRNMCKHTLWKGDYY